MDSTTKAKTVNLEDLQASQQQSLNKGVGNSCVCSTAAATAAKEVTLGTTFSLVSGAMILVTFTNGITSANSTLAVTHTTLAGTTTTETAKPIYLNGAALPSDVITPNSTVFLRYNGTQFDLVGGAGEGSSDTAYVGESEGQAGAAGFDPQTDTVHVTEQTLSSTQKAQARTNIDVYSKAEISALRAPSYSPTTKLMTFPATATFGYDSTTKIITLAH